MSFYSGMKNTGIVFDVKFRWYVCGGACLGDHQSMASSSENETKTSRDSSESGKKNDHLKSSKESTGEEAESSPRNPYGGFENFMRAYGFKIDNEYGFKTEGDKEAREADAIKSALKKVEHLGNFTVLHWGTQFMEDVILEKVHSLCTFCD